MCRGLATLAALAAVWEQSDAVDYVDGALPLMMDCLRAMGAKVATRSELSTELRRRFGVQLSEQAVESVLTRARRLGLVFRSEKCLYVSPAKLGHPTLRSWLGRVREDQRGLLDWLVSWASAGGRVGWTHLEADGALCAWLRRTISGGLSEEALPLSPLSHPPLASDVFLISSVMPVALDADEGYARFLVRVVKGILILRTLSLSRPSEAQRPLRGSPVLFDSRSLAFALGFGDRARQVFYRRLISMTRLAGGSVRCSEDTLTELRRALSAARETLRLGSGWWPDPPTRIEAYLCSDRMAVDVEMLTVRLDASLRSLAIELDRAEYPNVAEERDDGERAASERRPVVEVRHGPEVRSDWKVGQDLASGEGTLAASSFFALLWPKQPTDDAIDGWLRSACRDLTEPSEELWRAYVSRAETSRQAQEIGAEDYLILTASREAPSAVMDLTLGDASTLFIVDTHRLVEAVRAATQGDLRAELEAERERVVALRSEVKRLADGLHTRATALASRFARGIRWTLGVILLVCSLTLIAARDPDLAIPLLAVQIVAAVFLVGGRHVNRMLSRLERFVRVAIQEHLKSWLRL